MAVQAARLEELHRKEKLPVVLADLVNGHDVRMVETRHHLGFVAEAPHIVSGPGAQQLERDEPMQALLLRPVHRAHPTTAEFGQQLVVGESDGTMCHGRKRRQLVRSRLTRR